MFFFLLNWMFQHDCLITYCSVLYACVFYFCICTCSAQSSMFHMEKRSRNTLIITMAGMPCQTKQNKAKKPKQKKKKEKKKGKADLTTVLHIRELPHLHMKLAVWFSFPTTNNKNPMKLAVWFSFPTTNNKNPMIPS